MGISEKHVHKEIISKNEVNEAADRIIGGIAGTAMEDTKNKKRAKIVEEELAGYLKKVFAVSISFWMAAFRASKPSNFCSSRILWRNIT